MAYNHAAAFAPKQSFCDFLTGKVMEQFGIPKGFKPMEPFKGCPPFESPVTGFPEIIKGTTNKYPTKAQADVFVKMFEASEMPVLELRVFWINGFVEMVQTINPAIGRANALDWVASIDGFPPSEAALRESLYSGGIMQLAERCAAALSQKL